MLEQDQRELIEGASGGDNTPKVNSGANAKGRILRRGNQGASGRFRGVILAAMKKPLILAVDDAPDLLALMSRALAGDYEVRTATSGARALIAAAAKK